MLVEIREATVEDANAIATVHVDSWQAAYRGILPEGYLANLSVMRRTEAWHHFIVAGKPRVLVAHADADADDHADAAIIGWVAFGAHGTGTRIIGGPKWRRCT